MGAAEFPHLPLPDVAKTMERYLDAIAAVVPAEDHARARLQVGSTMKTKLYRVAHQVDNHHLLTSN